MRWLIVFVLACIVFSSLQGWLRKVGLGRLPGDVSFRFRGRVWNFPFGSCALLTTLMFLIGYFI